MAGSTMAASQPLGRDSRKSMRLVPEAPGTPAPKTVRPAISSVPAGWTSLIFRFQLGSRHLAAGADEAACEFSGAGKIKRKIKIPRARRSGIVGLRGEIMSALDVRKEVQQACPR